MQFKKIFPWLLLSCFIMQGCEKWDEHTSGNDQNLTINLLEEIKNHSNIAKFYSYLQKSGLDKELSSSKTYTVWAPTDAALQNLDPAIVADSAKLRQFMSNHIALQSFFTRNAQTGIRVPMLNGKYVNFSNNKFDEATITEADKYVANGVLHVIDKAAPVLPNGWELVNSNNNFLQNSFVLTQNFTVFDPTLAIIDSISSVTGLPVYRPGTGLVQRNAFTDQVYDFKKEDKLYTYFILQDTTFNNEVAKLSPYYKTGTADSTKMITSFQVVKDLAVEGLYTISQLPDTLISKFGVKIPIDKSKIVEIKRMSNGIAYVMSGVNFTAKNKIPTVLIQGEGPRSFFRPNGDPVDLRGNTFYRFRTNSSGQLTSDMFVYNHGIANLNVLYQARNLASVKYKLYWYVINDTIISTNRINPVTFSQRLAMGSRTATNFALTPIPANTNTEMYLGDYTQASFGMLDMFLTAANSTTGGANSLTLDYIKLVPDIP